MLAILLSVRLCRQAASQLPNHWQQWNWMIFEYRVALVSPAALPELFATTISEPKKLS